MTRFQDKVVLVTGGGSGQGAETCRLFAAEGANVFVADWNGDAAQAIADEIGGHAIAVDVSKDADVQRMIRTATETAGRLDILVNNAGVGYSETGRFTMANVVDTPEDAWDAIIAINLKGVAMGCKYALPIMAAQGAGAIVNIASISALVATPGADAYTASKGGVVALTRVMAAEWAPKGVRVNCICPGGVDTPMISAFMDDLRDSGGVLESVPMGRVAQPAEIARMTLALASEDASYVTGVILPVDGGMTAQ